MASLFTPALCFFKHTQCTHRETHKAALETHAYTNSFSFRHGPVFSERSAPLPLHRLTRLFIFPMPTLNSNIPLHPTPQPRRSMCAWPGGQKTVGKYQQVIIYIRIKTNRARRKELLRRSKAFPPLFFCSRNPSHVASGSLPAKSNMDLYTKKVLSLT